jgi:uncharacterized membrane protein
MDSKKRSLTKSIVWRLIAVINGATVAYLFLGSLSKSISIAVVANVTGFMMYYLHERIWNKVRWQRDA